MGKLEAINFFYRKIVLSVIRIFGDADRGRSYGKAHLADQTGSRWRWTSCVPLTGTAPSTRRSRRGSKSKRNFDLVTSLPVRGGERIELCGPVEIAGPGRFVRAGRECLGLFAVCRPAQLFEHGPVSSEAKTLVRSPVLPFRRSYQKSWTVSLTGRVPGHAA